MQYGYQKTQNLMLILNSIKKLRKKTPAKKVINKKVTVKRIRTPHQILRFRISISNFLRKPVLRIRDVLPDPSVFNPGSEFFPSRIRIK
jgi:hypothetical protein